MDHHYGPVRCSHVPPRRRREGYFHQLDWPSVTFLLFLAALFLLKDRGERCAERLVRGSSTFMAGAVRLPLRCHVAARHKENRPHGVTSGGRGTESQPVRTSLAAGRHISGTQVETEPVPEFPGEGYFGPGTSNVWVLILRLRLVARGYAEEYKARLANDPGLRASSVWDEDLRICCTLFQLEQGMRGSEATGYPTERTWQLLWA